MNTQHAPYQGISEGSGPEDITDVLYVKEPYVKEKAESRASPVPWHSGENITTMQSLKDFSKHFLVITTLGYHLASASADALSEDKPAKPRWFDVGNPYETLDTTIGSFAGIMASLGQTGLYLCALNQLAENLHAGSYEPLGWYNILALPVITNLISLGCEVGRGAKKRLSEQKNPYDLGLDPIE